MEKSSVRKWARFFLVLLFGVDLAVVARILGSDHTVLGTQICWLVYLVLTIAASWLFSIYMIVKKEGESSLLVRLLPLAGVLTMAVAVFWVSLITFASDLPTDLPASAVVGIVIFAGVLALFYVSVRVFCYGVLDN